MKNWLIGAIVVAVVGATWPSTSEARRFGGARSSGLQRDMPARTAPTAPPAKPATPQQAAPTQQAGAATPAGAAPAAAAKRSWMGPIAGLAAGLGIAALMSHLGLGEAFGNFLMLVLLGVAALFLVTFLLRRFGPNRGATTPALAGAQAGGGTSPAGWLQAEPSAQRTDLGGSGGTAAPAAELPVSAPPDAAPMAPAARAFVPAAFDSDGFARTAKMIFIRMQAANDAADLDDLRRFTTPELFAALRVDLQERGPAAQTTDVVQVDTQVIDVAQEDGRQIVSVRFSGRIVEEKGAEPTPFDEIWHLVKPSDDSRPWAIAGIEQMT